MNGDGADEVVHLLLCGIRAKHAVEGEADVARVLRLGDTHVDGVAVDADARLTAALRVLQRVQGPRSQHDLDTTVAIKRACSNIIIDIATTGRVTELSFPARRRCLGIFGTTEPAAGRQAGTPAHTSRCYVLSGRDGAPAPAAAGDSAPVAAAAGFLGVLVAVFPDGLGGMTAVTPATSDADTDNKTFNVIVMQRRGGSGTDTARDSGEHGRLNGGRHLKDGSTARFVGRTSGFKIGKPTSSVVTSSLVHSAWAGV